MLTLESGPGCSLIKCRLPFMPKPPQSLRNRAYRPRVKAIMKRYRTLLSVLLGLVLLVQGVAVAAAPYAMLFDADPVVMTMDADMPCHGQAASDSEQSGSSCCDAVCPDMTSCMLGHLAINASFQLTTVHSPGELPGLIPVRIIAQSPPSLLRPPITLHG